MSFARILAPLTGGARDQSVLTLAFMAAKPSCGHVVGLFVHPDPRLSVPYTGIPLAPTVIQDIVEAVGDVARKAEKVARQSMATVAAQMHAKFVDTPSRPGETPSCSFQTSIGDFAHRVGEAALLADLVVIGPVSPSEPEIAEGFLETLTKIDRPVLIAPDVPAHLGQTILIGWDGGLAAAHAVSASLPFLEHAEKVHVLSVRRDNQETSLESLREYLLLHGIRVEIHQIQGGAGAVERHLLECASKFDADLLVLGGYGHGFWREELLGGVTQHLRWHTPLPTLMVH